MTLQDAAQPQARLLGYDFARAVAIVGMVLINFPIFLAMIDGQAGTPLAWLSNLHYGRAAALFVTLAGAGIAMMSRGANPWIVRRTLLLRALFLFVLGNALLLVWTIDILHHYAVYLTLAAILLLALPRWALIAGVVLIAAATLAVHTIWPDINSMLEAPTTWPEAGHQGATYWSPLGMLQNVFVSGVHPVLPWFAFVMVGLWVGRHDLADAGTRQKLMLIGAVLGVGAPLLSAAIEQATLLGLLPDRTLLYTGVVHSPSPLYVVGAAGTSIFIIALSQVITTHWANATLVRAFVHAGQMALTLYLVHALVGVVLLQRVFGVENWPLPWVLGYALAFSAGMIVVAHIYRHFFRRGPVEMLMRLVAGSPRERAPADAVRLRQPSGWWPYAAVTGLAALIALQFTGAPPQLTCASRAMSGAQTSGSLTLLCPQQNFTLDVDQRADVVLETMGARDLVLELFDGEERIAMNDDGGIGANARLVATLEPGQYRVLARPFESAVGAFMLTRTDQPPTVRDLGPGQMCTDNCASARDGECDDGGPNSLYAICDIGSDCADCGVRNVSELTPLRDESGRLCFNTCASANDNECDDGGPNSLYDVCTLGSDCADCGPRDGP